MAWDDIVGGGPDFTADSVLDRVSRGVMSDLPDDANADMVLNRLNRKLTNPRDEAPKAPKAPKGAPDFSDQGTPIDQLPDFSSQGTLVAEGPPAPEPAAAAPAVALGATGQAKAALKGIPHGTIEGTGGAVQGFGTEIATGLGRQAPEGNEFAVNPVPTDAGGNITSASKAVAASPLVKAGKTIKGSADTVAPMTEQEKQSIGGRIGTGAGNILPYAVATLAGGPALGIAAGFTGMAASTYGDVFEEAKKAGASDEVAQSAASRSALVAGVLGSLPLGAGKYASTLVKKVASSAAAFTTAGEAQEAILQQIAKDYDPKAGYTLDQKRLIAELILGAGMGGLHHAFREGDQPQQPAQQPGAQPQAPSAGLPPPGPQGGGFTGRSRYDSGNAWWERERNDGTWKQWVPPNAGQQGGAAGAGPQPGPQPNTGGPGGQQQGPAPGSGPTGPSKPPPGTGTGKAGETGYTMDPATRAKMERVYAHFEPGKDPSTMSDGELFDAVNEHLRDTSSTGHTAKPETPEEAKARAYTAAERDERDELVKRGWDASWVNAMTPEQRQSALKTKRTREQAKPQADAEPAPSRPEAGSEQPRAADTTASENTTQQAESATTSSPDKVVSGTREAPIEAKTADDVLKAQPAEPKSPAQAEAENYQHAHVELPQFGLTGSRSISIETGVGQERKGVDADGKPWSVTLEHAAYGRLKGTQAADFVHDKEGNPTTKRQALDAFVGPHPTSPHVFIIDQHHPPGGGQSGFDEHKILLGFRNPIEALHAYAHSYNDAGKDRIGHVTAMDAEGFKAWLKTDTTKPLKPTEAPVASPGVPKETPTGGAESTGRSEGTIPENAESSGQAPAKSVESKVGEPTDEGQKREASDAVRPVAADENGEAAGPAANQERRSGEGEVSGQHEGRVPESGTTGEQAEGEEVTAEHHRIIETALGPDADKVAPRDIARAAELIAENEGMPPATAFGHAVIESLVEQNFLTTEQVEQAYGPKVKDILESGREGAPGSGSAVEQGGTKPDEVSAGGGEKGGVAPSGGEDGARGAKPVRAKGKSDEAAAAAETAEQPAAGRSKPAGDEAGDTAEHQPAAEDADDTGLVDENDQRLTPNEIAAIKFALTDKKHKVYPTSPVGTSLKEILDRGRTIDADEVGNLTVALNLHNRFAVLPLEVVPPPKKTERLAAEPKPPTSKAGESHGISPPVHGRDAGPEPEAVPPSEGRGGAGPAGEPEGAGGEPPVPGDHGAQSADDAERTGSGGTGPEPDVRVPGRHEPAEEGREGGPAQREDRAVKGENYRIEPGSLAEDRSPRTKATDNVQAIKLANRLIAEDRPATLAEQHQLARYVGWGGLKGAFPDADGNFGKGFEQIGADLKTVLTPEEYDTARRSIQYAHYTAEDVISGMWDIARRLGFKGGQVFEPGMGVGHFAGLMPGDMAQKSAYHGVEMDHVTARIAKLLYPRSGVRQADFTKMPLAQDSFDLVIGNPPFGDITIQSDPKYPQKFLLHDYFFAKSLDAVRPGGVMAFVTSAGTMNKRDPAARKYLAERAVFVGGVRLPSSAFKKNAGTEVTTDILVFRKRMPGETGNTDADLRWINTAVVELPGPTDEPIEGHVNQYFVDHPEMVLGKPDFADKLYEGRYSVKPWDNFDLKPALAIAIGKLPRNVMVDAETPTAKAEQDFEGTEKKDGSYYLKGGKLYQQREGAGREVERRGKGVEGGKTAAELERIQGLIPIRDALRETFAADLADDADAGKRGRSKLNKAYDAFVAKFGPINKAEIQRRRPNSIQEESARSEAREEARYAGAEFDEGTFDPSRMIAEGKSLSEIARSRKNAVLEQADRYRPGDFDPEAMPDVIIDKRPNIDPFIDDQESYRLRAIEKYDEPTGKATKGAVFSRNVISKDKPPEINSVHDAALYVLNQKGTLDLDAIAGLAKKSRTEAIEALGDRIYQVPGTKDTWETREKYLAGNVRKKLLQAKEEANRNPAFRRNVEALEAAQPAPLAPSQIGASLGMPWIPRAVVEQFATEDLGLTSIKANYVPAIATWTVSGDSTSVAATSTWGTSRRNASQLLLDALNRQVPKIWDDIGEGKSALNAADTQAAQEKMQAIRDRFNEWIFSDEKRADRLAGFYNENYNNLVVQEFNGDYLTTPGVSSEWSWRPHQKRGIARIIQNGNTYLAHAVGAGKTSEMIGAGMEMRRLGLVKKPMYTVPNHMLAQFTKEFYEQYPTARIMVADDRQFHTDRRKQFMANVAMNDLDAVIITHSSFGKIPVSDEFQDKVINDELIEYRKALEQVPAGQENRITRGRIEKQIQRLEQRLSGKGIKNKDSVFNFDELGVDFLFVDEAHLFRKLDFNTQMSNLKGVTPKGSQMAWDLFVKTKLLQSKNPDRNLVLASGTPVTNTMAELYSISRYIQMQELKERGLQQFDAWAGAFGENVTELEQDAAGGYKPVSRFAKFVNVAELSSMVRQVMDVVTSRQLAQYVVRPTMKGGKRQMNLADKSPALTRYQASLAARMKEMQGKKSEKGEDNYLKVIGDGRHAAIDMRLTGGPSDPNHPSKLDLMIDNVARIHKATRAQKFYRPKDGAYDMSKPADTGPATQMIFANLGLSGTRGFSVPDYIRAELVRRGVPRTEIAMISDYKNHIQKQKLFNDMNEGKVRVMIGSTAKMATGVNAQRRLYAIHNLDPLWYPADDEQRNGRGLRQGNLNPEIEIHDYSTKGTYDSTMWGMMEKKARFIQGFFEGDPSLRSMDDLGEASVYEQAKALTTNDPRLMKLTELRQDYEKANRRKAAFDNERYAMRQKRAQAKSDIAYYEGRQAGLEKDIKQRVPLGGDNFKAKVGKDTFTKRVEFGDALMTTLDGLMTKENIGRKITIGEISGFQLVAQVRKMIDEINVSVELKMNGGERHVSADTSGLGATRSMEAILGGLEHDLEAVKRKIATDNKFLKDSEDKQDQKFAGGAEIDRLRGEIAALQADLAKKEEPVVPAVGAQGQAQVLERGRQSGNENLIAYGADGAVMTESSGDHKYVKFTPEFVKEIENPANDIVAHHNHPSSYSLSHTDLMTLAYPGLRAVWAHGHNGSVYRGELTPAFKALAAIPAAREKQIEALYNHVLWRLRPIMQRGFDLRLMTLDEADGGINHLVNEVLAEAGVIDYRSNYQLGDLVSRVPELDITIKNAIEGARKEAFGDKADSNRIDRPTGPLQHAGDLGTSFERGEPIAGIGDEGRRGEDGEESHFDQRPGEGLAAPPNRFQPGGPNSFDNTIGDILGRRLLGPLSDVNATEMRVQLQDKFLRVQKAEQSVGAPTSHSAYQAESLYYGRTGQRLESLNEHHIDPLLKDMSARGIDVNGLDQFLYARHAPERNNKLGHGYRPGDDFYEAMTDHSKVGASGMSTDEALSIIRAARAAGKLADYRALAGKIDALNLKTRRVLLDSGLIDRDTFDAWNAGYKYYVPLRGFAEGSEHEESLARQGAGMNIRGKEAKTAFGRKSEAASPLAYTIMQAELAIVRAEKNKVGNTFLKFVRANPDADRWTVNRPDLIKRIDPATGLVTTVPNNLSLQADNVFSTKIDGKTVNISLKGPDGLNLARAMKNMGSANVHALIRTYSAITHTMAKLATSWNPDFMIPNFARDMGEAFINLQAQDQRRFVKNFVKHIAPALRGSMLALAGKTPAPGTTMARYVDAFHRFDKAGGRVRFFGIDDPDTIEANAGRKLKRLEGGALNTLKDFGDKAAKALEIAGGGIENATRLASFMAAEDVGISTADAAMLARNLTVDFNKKGELGSAMSAFYMFSNAGVQGIARTTRALGNRKVQWAVAALAAASALATAFSMWNGGEDEAGVPNYMKIPSWERDKNLIFMFGDSDNHYLKIPSPYAFSPFAVLASHGVSTLLGKEKPLNAAGAVMSSIISAMNPLGEESTGLMDVVPSAIRFLFHIAFNKNWTGKPLYPDNQFSKGKPDSSQFFKSDSAFSKEAAKKLNEWTGGGPYTSGAIDAHPGSIDHMLQAVGGGVGKFGLNLTDTLISGFKDREWSIEKTPLRRFVGKVGEQADAAAFYELRRAEKDREANVKQARKDLQSGVNKEEAREFIKESSKESRQKAIIDRADERMKGLRAQEDRINTGSQPYEAKRDALATVRANMRKVQNEARAQSTKLKESQGAQ